MVETVNPSLDEQLATSVAFIEARVPRVQRVGLVLGSGLGDFADALPGGISISTRLIPSYPLSTVDGHKGRLVFATCEDQPVLAFQGRIHLYECGSVDQVLYPIHVAHRLGIQTLLVTNAAGGINRWFRPGDLMAITDLIDLTSESRGQHGQSSGLAARGTLFDPGLLLLLDQAAADARVPLHHGVYVGMNGPSYETAAEVQMVERAGGDAVGMSTVLEAKAAVALGMKVAGVSCITNPATGISRTKLSHQDVTAVAGLARGNFEKLLHSFFRQLMARPS
jgi:purine-nucleoside phosphorylase